METGTLIVILLVFTVLMSAGIGVFYMLVNKKFESMKQENPYGDTLQMLNTNIQGMQTRIDKTNTAIGERLDNAAKIMGGVSKELGQVQEIGRHMQGLQDFFKSPKLRGNIGEQVLRDLLEQYFSKKHFKLQHKFKDGQMVDAIIETAHGLIPIDSKFPLENFQKMSQDKTDEGKEKYLREFRKDVKKHISDISRKYILPGEKTLDFAVMYIPSETIYYEIIRDDAGLADFAYEKKIFTVSPNSFFYFLKIIMLGIEGQKVEEGAKKIISTMQAIQKESEKFGDEIGVVNTHLTNANGALSRLSQRHSKLASKMDQVNLIESE